MPDEREPCDCDKPDCSLPPGRCAICGNPCDACHYGTEICARCVRVVEAFYEVERRADPHPEGPGWFLANHCSDGSAHIERDDCQGRYPDDEAAAAAVVEQLASPVSNPPERAHALTPGTSRPLSSSETGLVVGGLRDKARLDRVAAGAVDEPRTRAHLEHQALQADALAHEIEAGSGLTLAS